jgi:cellulose synthase/poly-beta-1,6-N-acetylglucosamine synthase-like glycosyltransferase
MLSFLAYSVIFLTSIGLVTLDVLALIAYVRREKKAGIFPDVGILIPALNEKSVIKNCIDSLLVLDYPKKKKHIFVIDNGSNDGTIDVCKEYEHKGLITLIRNKEKTSKAKSLNKAIESLDFKLFAIMDADCIASLGWLSDSVKHMGKKVGVVGAALRASNRTENWLTRAAACEVYLVYELLRAACYGLTKTTVFSGAGFVIKKACWEDMDGFNEDVLNEDTIFAFELAKKRWKVGFSKERIYQELPNSLKEVVNQRTRWLIGDLRMLSGSKTAGIMVSYFFWVLPLLFVLLSAIFPPLLLLPLFFLVAFFLGAGIIRHPVSGIFTAVFFIFPLNFVLLLKAALGIYRGHDHQRRSPKRSGKVTAKL